MNQSPSSVAVTRPEDLSAIGIVAALRAELGPLLPDLSELGLFQGLPVFSGKLSGVPILAVVSGVGKVRAALAASVLIQAGARRGLLSVGVCGGLRGDQQVGHLVHCTRAVQADLAVREGREVEPDSGWLEAWLAVAPGRRGWFLTADRPALSPWRRLRLARAYLEGDPVAEMETAAVASVARSAGLPWAALRAVSDALDLRSMGLGKRSSFSCHFPEQAGRAAASVPLLLQRLGQASPQA